MKTLSKWWCFTSVHSLGYVSSDYISFVIFHECACPPYWSKWKTPIFFHFSYKFCPILSKIKINDLWTEPHRNGWTDFWNWLHFEFILTWASEIQQLDVYTSSQWCMVITNTWLEKLGVWISCGDMLKLF